MVSTTRVSRDFLGFSLGEVLAVTRRRVALRSDDTPSAMQPSTH